MESNEIYILGVGHNTIVYIDLVETCGYTVAGLYHYNNDRIGERIHGFPIIDSNDNLFKSENLSGLKFAVSVGDNTIRRLLSAEIRKRNGSIPTLIHPTAVVSKYSIIEEGVVIHANSIVQADAVIGKDSVVSFNASVTHSSKIGDGCYLAACSHIGAYVSVGNNVLVGQGSVIASGKVKYIGNNSIIGAGSVVLGDIEDNSIIIGNPARLLKKNNE